MKLHTNNSIRIFQSPALRNIVFSGIALSVLLGLAVFITSSFRTEVVLAQSCESNYVLDWSDTSTYSISCGSVSSSQWTVSGNTCTFNSPVQSVGGPLGGPMREVDFIVTINPSGNLDVDDSAFVYFNVNGSVQDMFVCPGDSISSVFSIYKTIELPSDATYSLTIKLMNNKSNEKWRVHDGDLTACLKPLIPLPISLINFGGTLIGNEKIKLEWITQSEINNDYFTIEKSSNGIDFSYLGQVPGAGTSSTINEYSFIDNDPVHGINHYRLSNTNLNGTIEQLNVTAIPVDLAEPTLGIIKVTPNPFTTTFKATVESPDNQVVSLRMVTLSGSVVLSRSYSLVTGINHLEVNLPDRMEKGIYSVQVIGKSGLIGTGKAIRN